MRRTSTSIRAFLVVSLFLSSGQAMAFEMMDVVKFIGDPILGIGALLMKIFTALFIILGAIAFVGQYLFTQVMVKVALMMMPIMVPFIMLEKTRFIFEGWLKFLITAGFTKIVGAALFGMLLGSVEQSVDYANAQIAKENGTVIAFYVYSTLLLVTGLMVFIMMQTQQIGNALVSGVVQGGFRFNHMSAANKTGQAGSQLTKGGMKLGDKAAGGIGGFAIGGTRGASAAAKAGGSAADIAKGGLKGAASTATSGFQNGAVRSTLNAIKNVVSPASSSSTVGGSAPGTTRAAAPASQSIREKLNMVATNSGRK